MTTSLAPAEAGLLRAICEDPADDTPRLLLAAWWEEHGQEERAELVRVQIQLAGITSQADLRRFALENREQELWKRHHKEWFGSLLSGPTMSEPTEITFYPRSLQEGVHVVVRRGFSAEICCTLADWYGQECQNVWSHRDGVDPTLCMLCHGLGRVNAHGPAIVAVAPIERVTLTDREPQETYWLGTNETRWDWNKVEEASVIGRRHFLPPTLFSELTGGQIRRGHLGRGRTYESPNAAVDDFSRALLTWARRIAFPPV